MNNLTKDFIAIDTNVFEHLFKLAKKANNHIWNLIERLYKDEISLLIDSPIKESRILREYDRRLSSYYVKGRNLPRQEMSAESVLLKIFFENAKLVEVDVNQADDLMLSIKGIIEVQKGKPVTDRYFVYVAFKKERVLVTNDSRDILSKKRELKRRAKKLKLKDADILSSQEAYKRIANSSSAGEESNHE